MIDARKNLGLFGAALIGSMALGSSAFAVEPLPQGYQLASAKAPGEGKCGEGKCGEGKCGEKPKTDAKG